MNDENEAVPPAPLGPVEHGLGAWLPIDTAPRDGSDVLVYGRGSYAVAHWDGSEWRDIGDIGWAGMAGGDDNQPTHWMPLRPPPQAPNVGGNRLAPNRSNDE